jgi:sarcosine oxidase subunit alpha
MPRLARRVGVPEAPPVHFRFDGRELTALAGEPIAAALLANGIRTIRHQLGSGEPRGLYCAIGQCFECVATVDGIAGQRTCLTPVTDGMEVTSSRS